MASTCISNCINDARAPVRATYVNLYKWPESDAEFVRSMSSRNLRPSNGGSAAYGRPRVVDSISCRQLYLRSYTFSREEDYKDEKTVKCLGRGKEKPELVDNNRRKRKSRGGDRGGGRRRRHRRPKAFSCAALASIFRRLLSCTTKVDVVN